MMTLSVSTMSIELSMLLPLDGDDSLDVFSLLYLGLTSVDAAKILRKIWKIPPFLKILDTGMPKLTKNQENLVLDQQKNLRYLA
uniref:Uncharacterized protein n=1 Tax=Romanomermis culicivorax TaxID=13658 RepID=A0A915JJL2_ROMCU